MAETPPTTTQPRRRPSNRALAAGAVFAAVALVLVILVATTGSGDDEAATGSASITEPADVTSDSTTAGSEDGSATEDGSSAQSATSVGGPAAAPTTPEGDTATQPTRVGSFPNESSPAQDDDTATTTSPPVDPGTGSATTIAGAPPSTTTANASPPTTIVVTLPPTTVVVAPPTTPTVPVSDECTVVGTDDFDEVLIEVTVTSAATAVALLEVGFVLSSGGEEIVADFIALEFMAPGETAQVIAETFETVPAGSDVSALSCAIDAVNEVDLFDNQVLPGPDDSCSVIGVDEVGDLQLTSTVRNPSPDTADLTFSFAVRDAGGVRVISDVGFADEVGPGQLATQEVDTLVAPAPGLDVASLTCDIVGIDLF